MTKALTGCEIGIGWNGAKALGDTALAYGTVRVEAVGADWIIVRDGSGLPYAATFAPGGTPSDTIAWLAS